MSKHHTCNLCGLTCDVGPSDEPSSGPHGLIDQVVYGGYASTPGNGHGALDDGVDYIFSLCEFCLDWLFTRFKVPAYISEASRPLPNRPWQSAMDRVKSDDWRTMKQEFYDEWTRRTKARNE